MGMISRIGGLFSGPARTAPQQRSFAAARVDRLTSGWLSTTQSINNELRSDLDALRARARDLAKNNDYARKFVALVVANVVGPNGFAFQARVENKPGQQDSLANDAIEAALARWSRRGVCEVTGRMSFAELQRGLLRCLAKDGEYLLRKVRGAAAGNPFGFALQLLDIDRLDTQYNESAAPGRNAVVMGIEIDAYRRPVAYHILTSHPGEGIASARQRERVPADEIIHDFIPENPEQLRGIPWMSAAILSLHHLGKFEESALVAARKGADTLGFFVSPNGEPPIVSGADGNGDPITVSVPGSYDTLPEGYDFKPYQSNYPDAMLGEFCKNYLRRIASGLNVAYNGLANDLEGVNFSSIRSGVLDEREQWMTVQGWFIESMLLPVFEEWLSMALLAGEIRMPNGSSLPAGKRDKFTAHQWQGRRWSWVDPLKDIEASVKAIEAGLSSPYQVAAQMGMDVEDVLSDIARFQALAKEKGVRLGAAEPPAAKPAAQAKDDAPDDEARLAARRADAREAPPLTIHTPVNITVAADAMTRAAETARDALIAHGRDVLEQIRQEVADMKIEVQAPVVHVAAPNVTVENRVEPAAVTLEATLPAPAVTVSLPARRTDTEIRYNDKGEIISTTQIEADL